jgi:hypothetical protein
MGENHGGGIIILKKEIPLICVRKKATPKIKFVQLILTKLFPPSPRPLRKKKKKNSQHKNLVPNCSKLSRKVVQNCAKIVQKIKFSKSPEIAAVAARRNFGVEIPFLLKTTNKQTNKQQEQREEEIVMLQSVEKCVNKMYLYKQKKKKKKKKKAMEVLVLSLL